MKLEIDFVPIMVPIHLSCYGECPRQVRLQSSVANQFVRPLSTMGRSELILHTANAAVHTANAAVRGDGPRVHDARAAVRDKRG